MYQRTQPILQVVVLCFHLLCNTTLALDSEFEFYATPLICSSKVEFGRDTICFTWPRSKFP